jgi:hypothetical protein
MTAKRKPAAPITLKPDPANPNRMDAADKARMVKSLAEFGDLSAIILNRRTGLLIGGHQRVDVLADGKVSATDLPAPEPDGTVARGWIERDGRRYALRVVDWPEDKAHAALLAANRFGRVGQDDAGLLKDLLQELDTGAMDMDLTGFDAALAGMLAQGTLDRPDGDNAGASPWDRVGNASSGIMFSFGTVQKRLPVELFEAFLQSVNPDNLEGWLREAIRS